MCIPKNIINPLEVADKSFAEEITPFISDVSKYYQGKTLLLFTSHKMLKEAYYLLKDELEEQGICVLGHNIDGSRSKLIQEFKEIDKCVLLGANSFWEGVDIPGDSLKCVIMVKLPFWAPSIPTVEARLEDLDLKTQNGFSGFSVPQAVIKFKQGFGRLIRRKSDEGVFIILDKRIIEKRYGQKFLNSLPLKSHFRGEKKEVLKKIKQWNEGPRQNFNNFIDSHEDLNNFLLYKREK